MPRSLNLRITMNRLSHLLIGAVILCLATTALAQPRPGPGRSNQQPPRPDPATQRRLEEQLDRLDARLREIERNIARFRGGDDRGPGGPPAARTPDNRPGGVGAGVRGPMNQPGGLMSGMRGFGGFGGRGGPMMGMGGFGGPGGGAGNQGQRGPNTGAGDDFAQRLDRIITELQQLQRDMRNRRR
jgi:hypothetical protein